MKRKEVALNKLTRYINIHIVLDSVIYYDWFVPEEERHDAAVKRNREALVAELKLWEGYLQKVVYVHYTHTDMHTHHADSSASFIQGGCRLVPGGSVLIG